MVHWGNGEWVTPEEAAARRAGIQKFFDAQDRGRGRVRRQSTWQH
jgi:hypothetical protein